ncbi:hypothetical protein EMIT0P74_30331 [Pseudomonas sp. IT-P74]
MCRWHYYLGCGMSWHQQPRLKKGNSTSADLLLVAYDAGLVLIVVLCSLSFFFLPVIIYI